MVSLIVESPAMWSKSTLDEVFINKGDRKLHRSGKGGFLDRGEKAI